MRRVPLPYLLGPCKCQGCGEDVVLMRDPQGKLGWLHGSGEFRCDGAPVPGTREYNREWMRRHRARAFLESVERIMANYLHDDGTLRV